MSDEIRIFISYAREDQPRVRELYDLLVEAGYHPWLDREHLLPGQQWEPIIKRALKQSHFALVCLSATSINKRGFLQKEIKQALEQALEKFEDDVWLIPARLDDCDVPDALAHIQWVDLFDDDGLQQLLAAMNYQLNKQGITPPSGLAKPKSVSAPLSVKPPEPVPEPTPEKPKSAPEPKQEKPYSQPAKPLELKPTDVASVRTSPSRSFLTKSRAGIASVVVAAMVLLGYGLWPDSKPDSIPNYPPIQSTSQANSVTENLAAGITIEMVNLPGGEFTMGANDGESDEKPPHQVKLSPFAIGKYEVTQAQWKAVMADNPSRFNWSDDLPVENVSWNMVQDFLRRLNGKFRLPTEAEWEYAARAGSQNRYSFGDDAGQLHNYAWFWDNSDFAMQAKQTHPVGRLKPNAFGLFDMHGNVWEWCSDWYGEKYYQDCKSQGVVTDPPGPRAGASRVLRGGGWANVAVDCRSALRSDGAPGSRGDILGFRLVRIGR